MIGSLKPTLQHRRLDVRPRGAHGQRARQRMNVNACGAATQHQEPPRTRCTASVFRQPGIGNEGLLARAARGREWRRIDDDELELSLGVRQGTARVVLDEAYPSQQTIHRGAFCAYLDRESALVHGDHLARTAARGRQSERSDETIGIEHALARRQLFDSSTKRPLIEIEAGLLAYVER